MILEHIKTKEISGASQTFNKEIFKEKPIIIDAGSRYGDFAIDFATSFPNSYIICIEPEEKSNNILNAKIKNKNNIRLIPKILWYKKTLKTMYMWDGPGNSIFPFPASKLMPNVRKTPYKYEKQYETITLKELIDEYGTIDLLKMNVEGSEFEIIRNTPKDVFENIKQITMEVHTGYNEYYSFDYMFKLLQDKGFKSKKIIDFAWEQAIIYAFNPIFING